VSERGSQATSQADQKRWSAGPVTRRSCVVNMQLWQMHMQTATQSRTHSEFRITNAADKGKRGNPRAYATQSLPMTLSSRVNSRATRLATAGSNIHIPPAGNRAITEGQDQVFLPSTGSPSRASLSLPTRVLRMALRPA
jgi:hypothetical protein